AVNHWYGRFRTCARLAVYAICPLPQLAEFFAKIRFLAYFSKNCTGVPRACTGSEITFQCRFGETLGIVAKRNFLPHLDYHRNTPYIVPFWNFKISSGRKAQTYQDQKRLGYYCCGIHHLSDTGAYQNRICQSLAD